MDRLAAQDMSMLWPDTLGWPQDIGVLAIIDGQDLLDANGRVRIDAIRHAVGARLHLTPRFRQFLHVPHRGLGWPLWVDAVDFDLDDHIRVAPAGEAPLLCVIEQLRRRPLSRSRPLWEMWLVPGLEHGRLGLFVRAHHAMADGAAGVALLTKLLDPDPSPARPWRPTPMPAPRELFVDNVKRRARAIGRTLVTLSRPVTMLRSLRRLLPWTREIFMQKPAPRISFNRPIGPHRTFTVIRSSLDMVKKVAHANNATVNDVLMATIAGGLSDFLRSRGECVEGVALRAVVPVSLHTRQPGPAQGNVDGAMFVTLPVGEADLGTRLRLIAAETAERKKHEHPAGGVVLRNALAQRVFMRHMARQRWVNVYVANLPGPSDRLCLAGAPLFEVFPVVPLTGNLTLGVGALSYAGQFNITVVADPDACPDAEIFAEGVQRALQSLATSVHVIPGGSR